MLRHFQNGGTISQATKQQRGITLARHFPREQTYRGGNGPRSTEPSLRACVGSSCGLSPFPLRSLRAVPQGELQSSDNDLREANDTARRWIQSWSEYLNSSVLLSFVVSSQYENRTGTVHPNA